VRNRTDDAPSERVKDVEDDDDEEFVDDGGRADDDSDDESWDAKPKKKTAKKVIVKKPKAKKAKTTNVDGEEIIANVPETSSDIAKKRKQIEDALRSRIDNSQEKWWSGYHAVSRSFLVKEDCTEAEFQALFPSTLGTATVEEKKTTVVTTRTLDKNDIQRLFKFDLHVPVYDKGDWNAYKPTVFRGLVNGIVKNAIVTFSSSAKKLHMKFYVINDSKKFKKEKKVHSRGGWGHRRGWVLVRGWSHGFLGDM